MRNVYDQKCWKDKRQPDRTVFKEMVERGGRFLFFRKSGYEMDGTDLLFRKHIAQLIADECNASKDYKGVSGGPTPSGTRYLLSMADVVLPRFVNVVGGMDYRSKIHTIDAVIHYSPVNGFAYDLGCFDQEPSEIPPDELLWDHQNAVHLGYLVFTSCTCELCATQRSN